MIFYIVFLFFLYLTIYQVLVKNIMSITSSLIFCSGKFLIRLFEIDKLNTFNDRLFEIGYLLNICLFTSYFILNLTTVLLT